jgi:polynucleotide 5'-hydroxyl-kinase GRC3/NOL9
MQYLLGPASALIVRGPASIKLLKGDATALGAPLDKRKLVVREDRQLPVETDSEADLDVVLAESAQILEVKGSTIPSSWHSCLEAIAEMNQGKVLIVGASDMGKSTLSTFLANGLIRKGIKPRIIDADIGQADIGPPTAVASTVASHFLSSLADLTPMSMIFVGHTSPSRVQSKLMHTISRLSKDVQESLTLINTDGWALDPEAVIYKIELIESIRPDLILGIAKGRELEPILRGAGTPSMRIEASTMVLERSQSNRRQIRTAAYRRYLDGGKTLSYSRLKTRVSLPSPLTSVQSRQVHDLRNLIVGLLDAQGYLIQIGVLLDLDENTLRVYSKPADHVNEVELGYVRISTNGAELGFLDL